MKKIIPIDIKSLSQILFVAFIVNLLFISKSFAKVHLVEIKNRSTVFTPEKITINKGDSIKWVNKDESIPFHMFASVPGASPSDKPEIEIIELKSGKSIVRKFDKPGRYPYFCFIHKGMIGEIIVKAPAQ